MRKYGESKTTRIMMATVRHVTSSLGLRKISGRWIFVGLSVQTISWFHWLFWTEEYVPRVKRLISSRLTSVFFFNFDLEGAATRESPISVRAWFYPRGRSPGLRIGRLVE